VGLEMREKSTTDWLLRSASAVLGSGSSSARHRRRGCASTMKSKVLCSAFTLLALLNFVVHGFEVPEVEWISPSIGYSGGGETVTLSGKKLASVQNIVGVELTCKFDNEYVPAYYIDTETVKCTAPPHIEGFVNVEFALNNETGDFLRTKGYQFVSGAKVDSVFTNYGAHGGIVDVTGADMHVSQYCRFGDLTSTGYVVSSALMRCESPSIDSGTVSVDVSLTSSSFFEAFSSIQHVYTGLPEITRVYPAFGSEKGGTLVGITGAKFSPTSMLRCRFGAVEVMAIYKTSGSVQCASPSHKTSTLTSELRLTLNQRDFSPSVGAFKFEPSLQVESVSPPQVSAAGSSRVSLTVPGVVQTSELACSFGSQSVPALASGSDGTVTCIAPAGTGFVAVAVTSNGKDFEYSSVQLEMKPVVEISRIAPRLGAIGGGTLVRVEGAHLLQGVPVCRFGTTTAPAVQMSSALLTCETPALDEGTYVLDVSIVSSAVELAKRPQFIFDPAPVVTAVSPSMGMVEGGTTVIAAGHSFIDSHDLACKFGSIGPVVGEWIAEDEYRCVAPAHDDGYVEFDVGVYSDFGAADENSPAVVFLYADEGSITGIIDNGNNTVTITGSGFVPGQDVYCNLGNGDALVPGTVMSDGSVLCGLPEDSNGVNEYDIKIVDSTGNNVISSTDKNGILSRRIVLEQLIPLSGPSIGGTVITVQGDHFSPSSLCRFGTLRPAPAVFISPTHVLCESPEMDVGYHALAVSNNAFDWSVPGLPFEFMNTSSSLINHVAPGSGPSSGGTLLSLNGRHLRNDVSLTFSVGTIFGVAGRWLSSEQASCMSPAHIIGLVPVDVFHHNVRSETKLTPSSANYNYKDPSLLSSITPNSAFVGGGRKVELRGENFYGSSLTCRFGSAVGHGFSVGSNIVCSAPSAQAGFTSVEVSMNLRDFTLSDMSFQYVPKPKVGAVSPSTVPRIGGSLISVSGSNMLWSGTDYRVACLFVADMGQSATESGANVVSSALITCVTGGFPSETNPSSVNMKLYFNGAEYSNGLAIRMSELPEVDTNHANARGCDEGGAMVDIYGDFSDDSDAISCSVGSIYGISISHVSSEKVECVMPAHAPAADIPVTVAMNGRDRATMTLLYEFFPRLEVTEPHRTTASLDGGALVQFKVSHADGTLPSSFTTLRVACTIDLDVVNADLSAAGMVSCLAPSHASGFVAVGVQVQDIAVWPPFSSQLQYEVRPQIFTVQPVNGGEGGGDVLTLVGSHFSNERIVFGNDRASQGKFVSSALMLIEHSTHDAGSVVLSTLVGGSSSLNDDDYVSSGVIFQYFTEEDALLLMSPSQGDEYGGTQVTFYFQVDLEQNLGDHGACKFGTIAPIIGQITGNGLECQVQAHVEGSVPAYARLFGETFVKSSSVFSYHQRVTVASSAVYPAHGSINGGRVVRILHEDPLDNSLHCHIAGAYVAAMTVNNAHPYMSECIMPTYAPGFAQVSLGAAPSSDEVDSLFLFLPDPTIFSVFPSMLSTMGGEMVTLFGEDMLEMTIGSVECYFGDEHIAAHVKSSALVTCESPNLSDHEGRMALYVDSGGNIDFDPQATASVSYAPLPILYDISAEKVSSAGGQVTRISTMGEPHLLEQFSEVPIVHVGTIGPMFVHSTGSYFEVVTPAHAPTSDSLQVWLSAHLSSPFSKSYQLIYQDNSIELTAAVPSRASTEGLTDVKLSALWHELSSSPEGCNFGLLSVPATTVERTSFCSGGNERGCVDYTISCTVPTSSAGFVELTTMNPESPGLAFEIFSRPVLSSILPNLAGAGGGSVIHVLGEDLHNAAQCHFGHHKSPARTISSSLSWCESPASDASLAMFGISPHDSELDVSELGSGFDFVEDFDFKMISPQSGQEHGGTVASFTVWNLVEANIANDVYCRFGSIGPILGERQGQSVTCITPAGLRDTSISALLSYNRRDFYEAGTFQYFQTPELVSFRPNRGVEFGRAELQFLSDVTMAAFPQGYPLGCRLDGTAVYAEFHSVSGNGAVWCNLPPARVGFATLELLVSTDAFGPVVFEVFASPAVLNMHPILGPISGTTILHVEGKNLHESQYCVFGAESTEGHIVSSALAVCVTPPASSELVGFGMSPGDYETYVAEYGTAFEHVNDLSITGISPETGSKDGGTAVQLSLVGLRDDVRYSCKVGTFFPISSFRTQNHVLTCITPASVPRDVSFSISANDRDLSTLNTVTFKYQLPPRISGIVPRVGLSGGKSPVFITGSNFVNTTGLTCRFGSELTPATFLTSRSILCIAGQEQTGTRTVFVEVSTNGVDFSEQRLLFHFAQCPPGSYCPESEPILCPRGAFCGGGTNFTLCPPGTFQPRTGQADCLPTPVGYISPDSGAMTPVVCPRGSVCDSTGLALPNKPCPPGHYCLEGTRTSNFTDFSIPERPLPCPFGMYCTAGVVSKESIAYNFTTPQQCYAGYVCEPGSITPQGSGPCPPGHYCPPGQQLRCPRAMYCPGVANAEPKPCLPGEYNSEYGKDSCQKCPIGTICPGFAREKPELCTPGFVCDAEGLAVAETRCPAGHYCLNNTVTADPLAVLDEDRIVAAGESAGIVLDPENFRPKPCKPGTFCTEGVATAVEKEGSFKQPQPCKEGSFCEWATGDATIVSESATTVYNPMRPCPKGHYCPKRTYIPIPAQRGSFASGSGNAASTTCLPGYYTPYEGFEACLDCPAGFECVEEGTAVPVICDAGYFRSFRDSLTCRQCPKGTWSPVKGLTEESLCAPCNAGLVCAIDGMSNNKPRGVGTAATNEYSAFCDADNALYDETKCERIQLDAEGEAELCPEGYVCDARTSIAAHKCPDGYFCGQGTTPETQFHNKCPAGYYCPAGSSYTTRTQFPCQSCFFCPEGTGQVLRRCPTGTQSSSLATSLDDCSADLITFWRVMPVTFDLIEKAYYRIINKDVGNVTDPVAAASSLQSLDPDAATVLRAQIDAGRQLLQADPSAAASANTTNTTSSSDPNSNSTESGDPFEYMGACENRNFDLLNPTFILSDDGTNVAVDENDVPLMKFTLPRGHTATINLDWRFINEELKYGEHYELLIFTDPVIDDTICATSDYKTVPCPPWDVGDGITWINMKPFAGQEQEKKCPASQESLEMPFWFSGNNDGSATGYNVDNPAWGSYVWKRGMHQLKLQALDDMPFRIELRMLDGRYQADNRVSFLNTVCIDTDYPTRASAEPTFSVHAILPFEIDADFQSPLNAPLASTFYRSVSNDYFECASITQDPGCRRNDARATLDYNSTYGAEWKKFKYLSSDSLQILSPSDYPSQAYFNLTTVHEEDWVVLDEEGRNDESVVVSLPDVVEQEKYLLNEGLWSADQTLFAMDYLPFFSACRGFDSHIYFTHITETGYTPVMFGADREFVSYGSVNLVPPEETIFIEQYSPQVQAAVADEVSITVECFYEEAFAEASAKKRWYEAEGETLFHLTAEAESQEALFAASILANDQTEPPIDKSKYINDIIAQETIPVIFAPVEGLVVTAGIIPTSVTFEILYYQRTEQDKRIIAATVTMDEYVNANGHDGSYTLTVSMSALGWFDLLNFFAFDFFFYFVLFVAIGLLAVLLVFAVWVVVRIFTLLKEPPRFRFLPYLRIMLGPPLMGVTLGMLPFISAQFGFRAAFTAFPILTQFPISIDNVGREVDEAVVEQATSGRYAVCFLTVSMYMMGCCAEILVPAELKDEEEKELEDERYVDEVMFKPEVWKRSHFVLMNILVNVTNVFLIEFSFTDTFGVQFFTIFFLLKVVHVVLEMQIETALGEAFLLAPISVVLSASVGVATIGADDFTDFTLGFFFETIMGMVEYVYLDAFIAYCAIVLPDKISALVNFVMDMLPFNFEDDDEEEEEVAVDAEDTLVEDLMGFLAAYGVNTAGVYMSPFFIFFFWDFNDHLRLSYLYGFRKRDLLIYFLFSVVIIPFQIIMDVLTFNIQELFHGWKVYEYLKYARYRFVNRTSRWKGLERVYDESIDPGLRAIDQMCFSSQFYFVLALGGSGSFLFVLSLSMMLRANYNMFGDILFWAFVIMVLGASYCGKRLALIAADRFGLWRITSAITSGDMIVEDDVDEDFTSIFVPAIAKQAEVQAPADPLSITTADLTNDQFRHLFMSKNRDWVIDQLQEILSPRTAKRLKLGKAVRRRMKAGEMSDSDDDIDDDYGEVRLTEGSNHIMRIWLTHAAARASGRGSHLLMLSDTSESETEAGVQRFAPVKLSESASAALTGWLAAVKQLRANRQSSTQVPASFSSTDFSSGSDSDAEVKFESTKHMGSVSKDVMRDWLARAREMRAGLSTIDEDVSDDSFDSADTSPSSQPSSSHANLSHLGASIMNSWLQHVRMVKKPERQRKKSTPSQQDAERSTSDSSTESSELESSSDPELTFDQRRQSRLSPMSSSLLGGWLAKAKANRKETGVGDSGVSSREDAPDISSDSDMDSPR